MHEQPRNPKRARNISVLLAGIAILCVAVFIALQALSHDDATVHPSSPDHQVADTASLPEQAPTVGINLPLIQMNGVWRAEVNDAKFVATVKDRFMTIEFGNDTSMMTYWYGTFVDEESSPATITSVKADTNVLVMSRAKSKDFQLKDDILWFEFKAMGTTTKVGLQRA